MYSDTKQSAALPERRATAAEHGGIIAENRCDQLSLYTTVFLLYNFGRTLGMGPDGHTASLFPGQPEVVRPSQALVAAIHNAPKPPPTRVSFTYRLINAAASVIVLVTGADKAARLREVLSGPADMARLPAQGVRPEHGQLVWLTDAAAAGALNR
jgi:6-phosphogluconolactonase/glucosamine-6-phosphate isomerase/deaminase